MHRLLFCLLSLGGLGLSAQGAEIISSDGYEDCIEIRNDTVRVVLEPSRGGRVLRYEINGANILFIDPRDNGLPPGQIDHRHFGPSAGRFDVGPPKFVPRSRASWLGAYEVKILGERKVLLIGPADPDWGVRVSREFELADSGTQLICKQVMTNESGERKRISHWSRTFAVGNGVAMWPVNPMTRFPKGYVVHGPGKVVDFNPEDPSVRKRDGILEIYKAPERPKFEMDPMDGWMAYAAPNNLLFIKTFPVYPDKVYGEMTAATASIWYYKEEIVELEPIGPWEWVEPGESISYTETWYLFPFEFPEDRKPDLELVRQYLEGLE